MKTKLMIAILTENCYEIFDSLAEARAYAKKENKENGFVADFNEARIYREDNGSWNYEDFADTYYNMQDFKLCLNQK